MSPNNDPVHANAMSALAKAKTLHSNSQVELLGQSPYYVIGVHNQSGKHDTQFDAIDGVPVMYGRLPV